MGVEGKFPKWKTNFWMGEANFWVEKANFRDHEIKFLGESCNTWVANANFRGKRLISGWKNFWVEKEISESRKQFSGREIHLSIYHLAVGGVWFNLLSATIFLFTDKIIFDLPSL